MPLLPPLRLTETITEPTLCVTVADAATSASVPGSAAPLPVILTASDAVPRVAPFMAPERLIVNVLVPLNPGETAIGTVIVRDVASPSFHTNEPEAFV